MTRAVTVSSLTIVHRDRGEPVVPVASSRRVTTACAASFRCDSNRQLLRREERWRHLQAPASRPQLRSLGIAALWALAASCGGTPSAQFVPNGGGKGVVLQGGGGGEGGRRRRGRRRDGCADRSGGSGGRRAGGAGGAGGGQRDAAAGGTTGGSTSAGGAGEAPTAGRMPGRWTIRARRARSGGAPIRAASSPTRGIRSASSSARSSFCCTRALVGTRTRRRQGHLARPT